MLCKCRANVKYSQRANWGDFFRKTKQEFTFVHRTVGSTSEARTRGAPPTLKDRVCSVRSSGGVSGVAQTRNSNGGLRPPPFVLLHARAEILAPDWGLCGTKPKERVGTLLWAHEPGFYLSVEALQSGTDEAQAELTVKRRRKKLWCFNYFAERLMFALAATHGVLCSQTRTRLQSLKICGRAYSLVSRAGHITSLSSPSQHIPMIGLTA